MRVIDVNFITVRFAREAGCGKLRRAGFLWNNYYSESCAGYIIGKHMASADERTEYEDPDQIRKNA